MGESGGQQYPRPDLSGDSILIESGRLHAIGAGFLIHEIQQNSETTYRVFDWNRCSLDGKPRHFALPSRREHPKILPVWLSYRRHFAGTIYF